MILSASPLTRRVAEQVVRMLPPQCLRICAISVAGSAGTPARFRQDLARAQQIFGCAGVLIQEGGFLQVNDNSLLDLTKWTVSAEPADAKRLLAMGPACGRQERNPPIAYAYYVRTLGGGYNGIGRPNFANNAPGLVISDVGNSNTFAHEVGHILGLDHDTDTNNIMYFDSPNITSDPPVITDAQCRLARQSTIPLTCPSVFELPPVQAPRLFQRPPFESTPELQGLLSDDPNVVDQFAARGQAILPALLSRVQDPNPAVRARVVAVLARIGTPMALQAVEMAVQTDTSPTVRATAAEALSVTNNPAVGVVLNRALQVSDPGLRASILRSLADVRQPGVLMNIGLAAMRESDPAVRLLASRLAMGLR